ncbi:MAG: hypothetical protein GY913_19255 [Proteobacteria bacterium]|nr:hypothetical protein [Pseudomonadota bacterium]MCP4919048.1 hypothetical protein [Pseudomonadota bacterium]
MIRRVPADDWRGQGQEAYLCGLVWRWSAFTPYRPEWEHDHCECCSIRLSKAAGDLQSGFVAQDGYRWICKDCFDDFRDEIQATVAK